MIQPERPRLFFPGLTALRGIASLWVVVLHASLFVGELLPGRSQHVWNFFARPGFLGVDVFFVLSGFVMSVGYSSGFSKETRWAPTWGRFIRNRAARIFPAHLAVLLPLAVAVLGLHVDLAGAADEHRWSTGSLIMALLLVQSWFGRFDAWNAVAWSVSAEWLFYLLFPIIVGVTVWVARRLGGRWSEVLGLVALAGVALAETLYLRDVTTWHSPLLLTSGIEFAVGALFWQSRLCRGTRLSPASSRSSQATTPLVLGLVFGSAVVASRGWPPHGAIVVIPLLVSAFTAEKQARWLRARWLQRLGDISYSLYLLHYPWQWLMRTIIPPGDISGRHVVIRVGVLVLYLIPPFLAASLLYRLVEMPGKRVFSGAQPRTSGT